MRTISPEVSLPLRFDFGNDVRPALEAFAAYDLHTTSRDEVRNQLLAGARAWLW